MTPAEWLAPGRKTILGWLKVMRGSRKRSYGLLGDYIADAAEEATGRSLPRYADMHSVWWGRDPSKPTERWQQMVEPFVRYRATRPIPGLESTCSDHLVEVTCTVGEPFRAIRGAYITRATGRCLTCLESLQPEEETA